MVSSRTLLPSIAIAWACGGCGESRGVVHRHATAGSHAPCIPDLSHWSTLNNQHYQWMSPGREVLPEADIGFFLAVVSHVTIYMHVIDLPWMSPSGDSPFGTQAGGSRTHCRERPALVLKPHTVAGTMRRGEARFVNLT